MADNVNWLPWKIIQEFNLNQTVSDGIAKNIIKTWRKSCSKLYGEHKSGWNYRRTYHLGAS